jgi:hypothetical protein
VTSPLAPLSATHAAPGGKAHLREVPLLSREHYFSWTPTSGLQLFLYVQPPSLFASRIVPAAASSFAGQLRRLHPSRTCIVALARSGYATRSRRQAVWRSEDSYLPRFTAFSTAPLNQGFTDHGFSSKCTCESQSSQSPLIVVSFLQRPPEENHCRAQHQDGRGPRHRFQADYARRLISDEREVVGPGQRLERKIARRLVRRWHKIEGDLKPGAPS